MSIAAEQWKAEGMQIGEIKGKAAGIEAGKADLLLRLLRRRFGSLPESAQARVQCASEDQLNEWAESVIDAGCSLQHARDQLTPGGNTAGASVSGGCNLRRPVPIR